jgi:heparan-alpha-glucosaminide N-acetyltransferase
MSTTLNPVTATESARTPAPRVVSIDIFRGLTMAVMIFVNQLSGVPGLPWWTRHAPAQVNVMTYVDMVFPFFLFIVGMSLPLSVTQRLKKNPSIPALWIHILLRFFSLLALGLILANAEKADPVRMGISGTAWGLLGLIAVALYLNVYPRSVRFPTYSKVLRTIGLVGVVVLFAIFRRSTADGQPAWIDFSYPEILGLIAFSYLAVSILYIPTRRWNWAAPAWFVALVALNVLSAAKIIGWPVNLPLYLWPFNNGSMACIIMAGAITSWIYLGHNGKPSTSRPIVVAIGYGLLMLAAGWLLTPLGISKIRATPTWSLYSIGAAVLIFSALYWICDVKQRTGWSFLLRSAGSNTLLTYLLPDLWYFAALAMGFKFLQVFFKPGWAGVLMTFAFTFAILAIAGVLTKLKVRLQL